MILDTESKNNKVKSGLYIVSTPIGNLSDITLRAHTYIKEFRLYTCVKILRSVKKFARPGMKSKSKLISNHKFNEKKNLLRVIEILKSGCVVSLISDAGTPLVSDPGAILINECANLIRLMFFQYLVCQLCLQLFLLVDLMKNIFFMDSFLKRNNTVERRF